MKNSFTVLLISLTITVAAIAAASETMNYYDGSMAKMHEAMMKVQPTGNADVDFARQMIPHHQGALEMAQIELKHGKDPELRRLAQDIIVSQQAEIKQMNDWLAAHQIK